MNPPVLETEHLILRPVTLADAQSLYKHFNNWDIIQHLSKQVPWPYNYSDAEDFIKNVALPSVGSNDSLFWAITPKDAVDKNQLIGLITYRFGDYKSGNRGFWISQNHQGKGLMTETVTATQDYVFFKLEINQIIILNAKTNQASRRIKEKTNAKLLDIIEFEHHNGEKLSERWLLTRESWAKFRNYDITSNISPKSVPN